MLDEIAKEVDELKELQNDLEEYVEKSTTICQDLEESMSEEDEENFDEIECPHCGETICIYDAMGEDGETLTCPICEQPIDI